MTIDGPRSDDGQARAFRPTGLMERASRILEDEPELSKNALVTKMGGKKEASLQAVDALVREGYVSWIPGRNNAQLHTSQRMYRQVSDPRD